jgi:hypothetical protein
MNKGDEILGTNATSGVFFVSGIFVTQKSQVVWWKGDCMVVRKELPVGE